MKYVIFFYLAWSSVAEYFIKNVPQLSGLLSWVDEVLALVLLLHLLLTVVTSAERSIPSSFVGKPLLGILIICIFSFLVNRGSIVNALQFVFSISKPFILFYWILTFADDDSIERFAVKFLVFLIALQVPFFLYGILTKGSGYVGDFATGATITGDAFQTAVYMWLGVILCIARYSERRKKRYIAFGMACMIMLVITSTRQVTLLLPIVVLVLLWQQLRLTLLRLIVVTSLGTVVLFFFFQNMESKWAELGGGGQIDFQNFAVLDMLESSQKIQGYYSALFEVPDEIPVPLLGAGPGEYASFTAMYSRTPLARKYIMDYWDSLPENMEGTLAYASSGIIAIFGDIGIVSLILLLYIYFKVFRVAGARRALPPPTADRGTTFLILSSCLLILSESLLQNIFEGNWFLLNFFWILAGSAVANRLRVGQVGDSRTAPAM